MRPFTARRLALAALVPALLVLSVIPGCSNQSEGERCGDEGTPANNNDCESGLVCTPIPSANTNRCCYADGHVTDSRCVNGAPTSATGHGAGSSSVGEAGATSTAGGGSSGTTSPSTEAGAAGLSAEIAAAGAT